MEQATQWIVENWEKIPDKFKENMYGNTKLHNLSEEDHTVVLLLDRQKPSIQQDYSFDEERIGVNKLGNIIWGFDSGCSCSSPWSDHNDCYSCSGDHKQFIIEAKGFDEDWEKTCLEKLETIKLETK